MNTLFRIISAVQRTASNARQSNDMGFIILCVRELLGDISTIHRLRGTLVALPYQLMLDISPVRAVGAKNKTHPVFINLFGVNNSPGSDFHIFGDVLHWISLLQRHFHCLISGPCSNSCLRFDFWICLQPTGGLRPPAKG